MSNNDLWKSLNKKYKLRELILLKEYFSNIKVTYSYLTDFVAFHKTFDDKFCLTAITKNHYLSSAEKDIEKCLNQRQVSKRFIIHYLDCKIDDDFYGDEYKDIYLMFFLKNEKETIDLLKRFQKLKVFI